MNKSVFLHKDLETNAFCLLDENMGPLYKDLIYVHLVNVSFVICEKNQILTIRDGKKTRHAWVEGTLVKALPSNLKILLKTMPLDTTGWSRVIYRSGVDRKFRLDSSDIYLDSCVELKLINGIITIK